MKQQLQFIATVFISCATGFMLAQGLAMMSPEVVMVYPPADQALLPVHQVNSSTEAQPCPNLPQNEGVKTALSEHLTRRQGEGSANQAFSKTSSLAAYTAAVAASQLPATALLIRLEDTDFAELRQQHQQDGQVTPQSISYQQQLTDFFQQQADLVQLDQLTCSSGLCEVDIRLLQPRHWQQVFNQLTTQPWWQSISYQRDAPDHGLTNDAAMTLILQQSWAVPGPDQSSPVADFSVGSVSDDRQDEHQHDYHQADYHQTYNPQTSKSGEHL